MFAFALIPVALFASQVAARAFPAPAPFSVGVSLSSRAIGISDIPDQCKSDCKAVLGLVDSCTGNVTTVDAAEAAEACLCTDSASSAYSSCFSCAASLPEVTDNQKSSLQSALDSATAACKSQGHPFSNPPKITGAALSLSPSAALAVLSTVAGMLALAV